ncbi:hypothetical protein AAC387_Pa03g1115 [Persea americana]
MIYRRWSLLITPPIIVGSIASVTLFYNFFLGGNERFFSKYKQVESSSATTVSTGNA